MPCGMRTLNWFAQMWTWPKAFCHSCCTEVIMLNGSMSWHSGYFASLFENNLQKEGNVLIRYDGRKFYLGCRAAEWIRKVLFK